MTTIRCPKCRAAIPAEDLNIQEGVGFCRACNTLTRLRDLAEDPLLAAVDPAAPPDGCSVQDLGDETRLSVSTRSLGSALGALAAALFWNGIVSIFVLLAIAGTLHRILGYTPDWFPAPHNDQNDSAFGDSLGGLIFLWIFLTPFIVIGLGLLVAVLASFAGRVEVRIDREGRVVNIAGPLRWTHRFDVADVQAVRLAYSKWTNDDTNQRQQSIEIVTSRKSLRFGGSLPPERRAWLTVACRDLLTPVDLR